MSHQKSDIICLLGFMGSGKTTLGKILANELGYRFVDLDDYLINKDGRSIPEIFAQDGERFFRDLELKCLKELLESKSKSVIALGGGSPCNDIAWEALRDSLTFYIKTNSEILNKRLASAQAGRPLLANLTEKEMLDFIQSKLSERSLFYNKADHIIDNNHGIEKAMTQIMNLLNETS